MAVGEMTQPRPSVVARGARAASREPDFEDAVVGGATGSTGRAGRDRRRMLIAMRIAPRASRASGSEARDAISSSGRIGSSIAGNMTGSPLAVGVIAIADPVAIRTIVSEIHAGFPES